MNRCLRAWGILPVGLILISAGAGLPISDEATTGKQVTQQADALKPFNSIIGAWRGVAQPQRGSRNGAWTEKVECQWTFRNGAAAILLTAEKSQQFEELKLLLDAERRGLVLHEKFEGGVRTYRGRLPEDWPGRVELVSEPDADGVSWRCTLQQLTNIRATLLFEKQLTPTGSFRRVVGIGYTRDGERLAVAGGNQRKCIVTGGLGTIPVTYKGKTWYVCCQGCVQAFNDAPEEIIADYLASLKEQKSK
ncbi:MAG: hypothetical protein RIK87_26590 [Fuerstiella sp.]